MAQESRQENMPRRAQVEDANYVLSSEEPNLPRVREERASGGLVWLTLVVLCAAFLALTAAMAASGRSRVEAPPVRTMFSAVPGRLAGAVSAGLELEDIREPVAAYYRAKGRDMVAGVGVYAVDEDCRAALLPGDVITAVNGRETVSAADVARALEDDGEALTLTVYRDGAYVDVTADAPAISRPAA